MRLIFSRKGFDSASGGCPSPILPDGSMIALPIPDRLSPIGYDELTWCGRNLGEVVERLTRGRLQRRGLKAHLDPDLRPEHLPRPSGWRPLFGQHAAAQGHLANRGVEVGDLFVFWGSFREVDDALAWSGLPQHVIWGWMRVGAVVKVDAVRGGGGERWIAQTRHPHLAMPADPTNTLYVAAEGLGFGSDLPGSGVFERFAPSHRLTAPESSRPSLWSLLRWMLPEGRPALSYHDAPHRWEPCGERVLLQTVGRGQEFVLDTAQYPEAIGWVERLVAGAD